MCRGIFIHELRGYIAAESTDARVAMQNVKPNLLLLLPLHVRVCNVDTGQ